MSKRFMKSRRLPSIVKHRTLWANPRISYRSDAFLIVFAFGRGRWRLHRECHGGKGTRAARL